MSLTFFWVNVNRNFAIVESIHEYVSIYKSIDIYESSSLTPASEKLFVQLQEHVERETEYMKHLLQIEGMLHILLASANVQNEFTGASASKTAKSMVPSAAAAANANLIFSVS